MEYKNHWECREPDFINEEGVKWWLDKHLTDYANREDQRGISLKNIKGFVTEKDSILEYVLVDYDTGSVVHSSHLLESVATKIDMMKVTKDFGDMV